MIGSHEEMDISMEKVCANVAAEDYCTIPLFISSKVRSESCPPEERKEPDVVSSSLGANKEQEY